MASTGTIPRQQITARVIACAALSRTSRSATGALAHNSMAWACASAASVTAHATPGFVLELAGRAAHVAVGLAAIGWRGASFHAVVACGFALAAAGKDRGDAGRAAWARVQFVARRGAFGDDARAVAFDKKVAGQALAVGAERGNRRGQGRVTVARPTGCAVSEAVVAIGVGRARVRIQHVRAAASASNCHGETGLAR